MTVQAAAFAFKAGQRAQLVVDGKLNTLAVDPGIPVAAAVTNIGDQLEYGRGNRGTVASPIGYFIGKAGFLALCERALGTAEMEAMTAALTDPRRLYGTGSSNLVTQTNKAPVGQPIEDTAVANVAKTTTVTTAAYDQNGDTLSVTDAAVVAGSATVTVPSPSQVRYTGSPDLSQEVVIDIGLSDPGLKTTRQRLYAQVSLLAPPIPPGEFPSASGFTTRTVATPAEFDIAYAASFGGDHVVMADGLVMPARTLGRSGTASNPIVIRGATNQGASFSGTVTITASNLYLWGFRAPRFRNKTVAPTNSKITLRRMLFDNGGVTSDSYISGEMYTLDFLAQYCTFSNAGGGLRFNNDSRRGTMQFCHWLNIFNPVGDIPAEALVVLEGFNQEATIAGFLTEDCLFENCNTNGVGTENETISNKSAGNIYRRVQFHNSRELNMRFGENCQVLGCVVPAATNPGGLTFRGRNHIANNCFGEIDALSGDAVSHTPQPASYFPNCIGLTIIGGESAGADGLITLGGGGKPVAPTGTRIEGRGATPNVVLVTGSAATIVPTTSVPLATRPNFPTGQGINNTSVGVLGGL